jgi:hypothetical protein
MCMFPRLGGRCRVGWGRVKGQRSRMVVVHVKERSGVQIRKYEKFVELGFWGNVRDMWSVRCKSECYVWVGGYGEMFRMASKIRLGAIVCSSLR